MLWVVVWARAIQCRTSKQKQQSALLVWGGCGRECVCAAAARQINHGHLRLNFVRCRLCIELPVFLRASVTHVPIRNIERGRHAFSTRPFYLSGVDVVCLVHISAPTHEQRTHYPPLLLFSSPPPLLLLPFSSPLI